ncbi:ABC transporter permease [Actinomadura sp. 1N219]|uniref:ABC transporter permease n=1 Tax=Actinomadura sp. 1N219 TaxID=3375152 RepID=UPI0037BE202A
MLGLTATVSGQISRKFDPLVATTVSVEVVSEAPVDEPGPGHGRPAGHGRADPAPMAFPSDADGRVGRLNGVIAAGVWWKVHFGTDPVIGATPAVREGSDTDIGSSTPVHAVSPGALAAVRPRVSHGLVFNAFHDRRGEPVTLISEATAERLGITQLETRPAVFVNGRPLTVIGIVADTDLLPELMSGMLIPRGTAERFYGRAPANAPEQMIIRTRMGAARLIARQAPVALRPDRPDLFTAVPPPEPRALRDGVTGDLTGLFLLLAVICLVVGAVGIANTTFVAVLERTGEIGLRRSLGARPRHIAVQFLTESTLLGLLGGLLGTCSAVLTVLIVALTRQWTAILDPVAVLSAPSIGAVTGLLAGLYPALHAARIEPQEALRH